MQYILDDNIELADSFIVSSSQNPGIALDNYFYRSRIIYQREMKHIIFKSWIYACHISELTNGGDFKTLEIGKESIIIVRDKNQEIHAFANTCRHRGSRICSEKKGNTSSFVCPYHAWVYNLQGQLIGARSMGDNFELENYGLKQLQVHVFHGLVFINCDDHAADFDSATEKLDPFLQNYHLAKAKIGASKSFVIPANWKLSLENYLECYHCGPSHKEYAKSHTLKEHSRKVDILNEAMRNRAVNQLGLDPEFVEPIARQYAKADAFGCDISHMRYALYETYKTGSLDGMEVAPLMGNFTDFDGGASDIQLGPLTFMLNYPDHCVLYRFLPTKLQESEIEITWFVDGKAEEGKDYDIDKLAALWDFTTLEDKDLVMKNQAGVNSIYYKPGPFSPVFEQLNINFKKWYLENIGE